MFNFYIYDYKFMILWDALSSRQCAELEDSKHSLEDSEYTHTECTHPLIEWTNLTHKVICDSF